MQLLFTRMVSNGGTQLSTADFILAALGEERRGYDP